MSTGHESLSCGLTDWFCLCSLSLLCVCVSACVAVSFPVFSKSSCCPPVVCQANWYALHDLFCSCVWVCEVLSAGEQRMSICNMIATLCKICNFCNLEPLQCQNAFNIYGTVVNMHYPYIIITSHDQNWVSQLCWHSQSSRIRCNSTRQSKLNILLITPPAISPAWLLSCRLLFLSAFTWCQCFWSASIPCLKTSWNQSKVKKVWSRQG